MASSSGLRADRANDLPESSLARRKPHLYLRLDESPQPASRFSNFSSVAGTPDVNEAPNGKLSRKSSSSLASSVGTPGSAVSARAEGSMTVPSSEAGMAGLGIGLPPALQSHQLGDTMEGRSSMLPLRTPERSRSGVDYSTPGASPVVYDRAGQIGIGELATPRWNFPTSNLNWSAAGGPPPIRSADGIPRSISGTISETGSEFDSLMLAQEPPLPQGNAKVSREAPEVGTAKRDREGEAARHARSISYSAGSGARRPTLDAVEATLPNSPSMPSNAAQSSISSISALHSLARGFDSDQAEFIAELNDYTAVPRKGEESPPYSIDAMSESGSSMARDENTLWAQGKSSQEIPAAGPIAGRTAEKLRLDHLYSEIIPQPKLSPKIGDNAWSAEETGPFGVASGPSGRSAATGKERWVESDILGAYGNEQPGFDLEKELNEVTLDDSREDESQWRSSFDLNAAISELLDEDDAKRRERESEGVDLDSSTSASEVSNKASPARKSLTQRASVAQAPAVPSARGERENKSTEQASTESYAARQDASKRSSLAGRATLAGSVARKASASDRSSAATAAQQEQSLRNKRLSSPAQATTSSPAASKIATRTSSVHLPSPTSSKVKRNSSASIGHSLLRGTNHDDFDGVLERNAAFEHDEGAAEALRKLDGLSHTPRSSREGRDPSKSPRTSKQLSRPGSAGRRTPGTYSRPSSPSGKARAVSGVFDSPAASKGARYDETPGKTPLRASRTRAREEQGISPHTSLDSPRTSSVSSPRAKKMFLPPLPQASGTMTPPVGSHSQVASTGAGKRASVASAGNLSVASRDSTSTNAQTSGPPSSVARASSKVKRSSMASDASSVYSTDFAMQRAEGSGSAAEGAEEPSSSGKHIPPVPPLPKAWESSRPSTGTFSSGSPAQPSPGLPPSVSSQSLVPKEEGHSRRVSAAKSPVGTFTEGRSPNRKWSFSNLSGALSRSPSSRRSDDKAARVRHRSNPALTSPEMENRRRTFSEEQLRASHSNAAAMVESSSSGPNIPSQPGTPSSTTSTRHQRSKADTAQGTPGSTASGPSVRSTGARLPPSSPRVAEGTPISRRTPSSIFFQKTSSGPSSAAGAIAAAEKEKDEKREKATTPSGRSSRKSILGLGGLLRSSSRKNMNAPLEGTAVEAAKKSSKEPPASASPRTSSFAVRRTSLVGRKRGKVSLYRESLTCKIAGADDGNFWTR